MDFALYNIYDHAEIIFEICYDAMQGDKLRAKVRNRQMDGWMNEVIGRWAYQWAGGKGQMDGRVAS